MAIPSMIWRAQLDYTVTETATQIKIAVTRISATSSRNTLTILNMTDRTMFLVMAFKRILSDMGGKIFSRNS